MAYTDTDYMPLHMPTPGTREPAAIALLNENCVVLSAHDHSNGKGVPVSVIRSGLAANRPAASAAGQVYFGTDSGTMAVDNGTAWVEFITTQGQVNLTDPIIRDTLQFGAKPNGAVDTTIRRTAAGALRMDTHLGVGAALPSNVSPNYPRVQAGIGAFLSGHPTLPQASLSSNSYVATGDVNRSITNAPGISLSLGQDGWVRLYNAPAVAPGTDQVMTPRLYLGPLGEFQLNPVAGETALHAAALFTNQYWLGVNRTDGILHHFAGTSGAHRWSFGPFGAGTTKMDLSANGTLNMMPDEGVPSILIASGVKPIATTGSHLFLGKTASYTQIAGNSVYIEAIGGGGMFPTTGDSLVLGASTNKWAQVWCTQGVFNGSHVSLKEDFAPLDAAACVEAVLETDWLSFSYKAPAVGTPEPLPAPEGETDEERSAREAVEAQNREMVAANAEAHVLARKTKGYVLGSEEYHTADLFGMADRMNASTQGDLAVVACALQDALRRLAALEAINATAA
jgi:hypothetical protein